MPPALTESRSGLGRAIDPGTLLPIVGLKFCAGAWETGATIARCLKGRVREPLNPCRCLIGLQIVARVILLVMGAKSGKSPMAYGQSVKLAAFSPTQKISKQIRWFAWSVGIICGFTAMSESSS